MRLVLHCRGNMLRREFVRMIHLLMMISLRLTWNRRVGVGRLFGLRVTTDVMVVVAVTVTFCGEVMLLNGRIMLGHRLVLCLLLVGLVAMWSRSSVRLWVRVRLWWMSGCELSGLRRCAWWIRWLRILVLRGMIFGWKGRGAGLLFITLGRRCVLRRLRRSLLRWVRRVRLL